MIQAFPSYGSDDSLDVSALPWRPRDAENFFDTQHLDLFPKLVSVNPISIPKQVFGCAVEWKGFDDLLGGPRGCWFESAHEFPSEPSAVPVGRDESSRSNTTGILGGANR